MDSHNWPGFDWRNYCHSTIHTDVQGKYPCMSFFSSQDIPCQFSIKNKIVLYAEMSMSALFFGGKMVRLIFSPLRLSSNF